MMTLILGGSGSGKSEYAEGYLLAHSHNLEKYYIATMQVYDEEGQRKVERHRRLRAGKGFQTIEQSASIELAGKAIQADSKKTSVREKKLTSRKAVALLECLSNLVANEMFSTPELPKEEHIAEQIIQGIQKLHRQVEHLVIVSNNVFEDGITYDPTTLAYMRVIGKIHQQLVEEAEEVIEVVVGLPIFWKKHELRNSSMETGREP